MTELTRRMSIAAGLGLALPQGPVQAQDARARQPLPRQPLLRAPRLRAGDVVGLVSPAGALYELEPYEQARDSLQALGLRVREGRYVRARHGHLAGTDAQRAADLNTMFGDPEVRGIVALTGGSGCARILPMLDYAALQRQPKVLCGFSDLTALINAVQARTGLVTFHAPMAVSEWNDYSVRSFRGVLMDAEALTLRNPSPGGDVLVPREHRTRSLRPGRAQGPLVGGNLSVLSGIAGSAYWPSFDGAILCLEEVNEYIYRVDRMLATLRLAGALDRLAGVVLGAFTNCRPGDGYGTLTLDEVFEEYLGGLGIPVFTGASFGHIRYKMTLPIGLPAEIDAAAGTLRLLQPAVT